MLDNSSNASKTGHIVAAWHKAGRVAYIILYLGAYYVSRFLFLWTALVTNLIASALLAYGTIGFTRL